MGKSWCNLLIFLVLIIGFANASTITTFTRTPSFVVDVWADEAVSTVNNTFWNTTTDSCHYANPHQPSRIQEDFSICEPYNRTLYHYAYWWVQGVPDFPSCSSTAGGHYIGQACDPCNINSCRPSYAPTIGDLFCNYDSTCQSVYTFLDQQPSDSSNTVLNPAYFFVPKNSNVTFASMNITGLTFNGSLPSNITISLTGSAEYNYTLQLNSTVSPKNILLNLSKINAVLPTCTSHGGNCSIPMVVTSSSGGVVRMENLNITYSDNFSRCGTFNENLTLFNNISTVNSSCINLAANNIVLDCNGYSINYTGTQNEIEQNAYYGINATGRTGITIKNCSISRFQEGISLTTTSNSFIQNNILTDNLHGIYSRGSSSNTFQNNQITDTLSSAFTTTGIYIGQYTTTTASENNVFNNTSIYIGSNRNGIYISSSTLDLQNNTISNSLINSSGTNNSVGIYNNKHSYLNLFHNINFTGLFGSAIWFNGGTLNTLNASTISSGNSIDILSNISSGSTPQNVILNSTFNASKFVFDTSSANLLVEWYLDVNITNNSYGSVSGAAVSILAPYFPYYTPTLRSFTTGTNGKIGNQIIAGQFYNTTGYINYSAIINASHPNYPNANFTTINITSSTTSTMILSSNFLLKTYSNQNTYNASQTSTIYVNVSRLNGSALQNVQVNLTLALPNSTILQSWNNLIPDENGNTQVQYSFSNVQNNGTYTINATAFNSSLNYNTISNTSTFVISPSYSFENSPLTQSVNIQTNGTSNQSITLTNPNPASFGNQNLTIYQVSNLSWATVDAASKIVRLSSSNTSNIFINATNISPGTYAAKITFYDPNGNFANQTTIYTITVSAIPVPNLIINTSSVSKTVNRATNYTQALMLNNTGTANATNVNCYILNSGTFLSVYPSSIGNLTNNTAIEITLSWNISSTLARGIYSTSLVCNATNTSYSTSISTTLVAPVLTTFPTEISKTRTAGDIDTCSVSNPNLPCFDLQSIGDITSTGTNCTATGSYASWVTSISPSSISLAPSAFQTISYSINIPSGTAAASYTIPFICNSSNYAEPTTMNLNLGVSVPAVVVIGGGGGGGNCNAKGGYCFYSSDCCGGLRCSSNFCVEVSTDVNFEVFPQEITPQAFTSIMPGRTIYLSDILVSNLNRTINIAGTFECSQDQYCIKTWCKVDSGFENAQLLIGDTKRIKIHCDVPTDAQIGQTYTGIFKVTDSEGKVERAVRITVPVGTTTSAGLGDLLGFVTSGAGNIIKSNLICFNSTDQNCILKLNTDSGIPSIPLSLLLVIGLLIAAFYSVGTMAIILYFITFWIAVYFLFL